VIKELGKREKSWQDFFISSGWMTQSSDIQRSKRDTPSVAIKVASSIAASFVKKPLVKNKSVDKRSAKKIHFSPEVEIVARGPRTRTSYKIFPIDPTPVQYV